MIFNGTLLVQIGNFLITYWFFNTFFLKKGYAVVMAEDKEFAHLQERVVTYKQLAHEAVQKKEAAWLTYSHELQQEKPALRSEYTVFMNITEKQPVIPSQDNKKLVEELVPVLTSLVCHPELVSQASRKASPGTAGSNPLKKDTP